MSTVTITRGKPRACQVPAPARVRVSAGALEELADACGQPPLLRAGVPDESPTVRRLHQMGAAEESSAPVRAGDGVAEARDNGLLDPGGRPTQAAAALFSTWHGANLAVDLQLHVCLKQGRRRLRSWHRTDGVRVVCLSTTDGRVFEVTWLSVADWWLELARAAHVSPSLLASEVRPRPLPPVLETPWELLVATGEAVSLGKAHLIAPLVAGCAGPTVAGDSPGTLGRAPADDVRTWHLDLEQASQGRLHALVTGVGRGGGGRAGVVEWVLFADGWRSLVPCHRDGWPMVRLQRRSIADLPRDVAVHAAGVAA